ncbi:MerR family transcriptional regulator [Gorillibacterium timonense]|uniref:MerR family transcriptional regulator n=1 Tax=Gorillibacterium timonense TaxID=1689269 RepID=UPI00071C259A|nr:MerR family transcriptional regulator [Gorillibacterium timonense]
MEYTIQKLGRMAGISTRTLRYYDEVGLLKPARINSSGYRMYGREEVDLLQQILFYRELGLSLEAIRELVHSPSFDGPSALREHRDNLLVKRQQLDWLIANVEKTLKAAEGRIKMNDSDKFDGFKKEKLEENERKYGREVREKYGEEAVEKSNRQWMNMTEQQYTELQEIEQEMFNALEEGMASGDPASEPAQRAAELHRKWITAHWGHYSSEAHAGVAQMYVADERFTAYYDKRKPGLAQFLRDAVLVYTANQG